MDPTLGYQAKRFVIEDSITKVSSDGEPHGIITIIAGCSGVVAAIIILAILASITECRIGRRSENENGYQQAVNDDEKNSSQKKKTAIIVAANKQNLVSITSNVSLPISSALKNQDGNLNLAFVNEEDAKLGELKKETKSTKKAHFNDNIPLGELYKATETRIEIERF